MVRTRFSIHKLQPVDWLHYQLTQTHTCARLVCAWMCTASLTKIKLLCSSVWLDLAVGWLLPDTIPNTVKWQVCSTCISSHRDGAVRVLVQYKTRNPKQKHSGEQLYWLGLWERFFCGCYWKVIRWSFNQIDALVLFSSWYFMFGFHSWEIGFGEILVFFTDSIFAMVPIHCTLQPQWLVIFPFYTF